MTYKIASCLLPAMKFGGCGSIEEEEEREDEIRRLLRKKGDGERVDVRPEVLCPSGFFGKIIQRKWAAEGQREHSVVDVVGSCAQFSSDDLKSLLLFPELADLHVQYNVCVPSSD